MTQHIVIAGLFPPPIHGLAYITQEMAALLASDNDTTIIDLSPHRKRAGLLYHLRRSQLAIKALTVLIGERRKRDRIFYVACEGGLGLVYTSVLSFAAQLLGFKIFVHHHSFIYIDARRLLMSFLIVAAGSRATHIFLCQAMAKRFSQRYEKEVKSRIVSNSAFVAPVSPLFARAQKQALTIGMLSNLDDSKGLGSFLDVLRAAASESLGISGVLAGPPQSDEAAEAIKRACCELGARLDYRGPVYGAAKDDFFRAIDVFVFPTRYANEAQPTVVFEALAYGIPVLSFDRGCIRSQVQQYGAVLERGGDFTRFAISWLKEQLAGPEAFLRLRIDTQTAFVERHKHARQAAAHIFETTGYQCLEA